MAPRLSDFPAEINGAAREACPSATCFKCKTARTSVAYRTRGRAWPTCHACALRAAKECPVCGRQVDIVSFDQLAPSNCGPMKIRTALRHADGSHCHPLEVDERYALPCSSCGAMMRFRLRVGTASIGGLPTELICTCGARWALADVRRGYRVYLTPVA